MRPTKDIDYRYYEQRARELRAEAVVGVFGRAAAAVWGMVRRMAGKGEGSPRRTAPGEPVKKSAEAHGQATGGDGRAGPTMQGRHPPRGQSRSQSGQVQGRRRQGEAGGITQGR